MKMLLKFGIKKLERRQKKQALNYSETVALAQLRKMQAGGDPDLKALLLALKNR